MLDTGREWLRDDSGRRLTKQYGTTHALQGINFTVPAGQICGYLGPNGAGKSTTVKILTGVLSPTTGEVRVAGFDVMQQPLEVKRRIGYVPETGAVYATLIPNEYLTLAGTLHHMQPDRVAKRARHLLRVFEIEVAANRRLATLSKGMRQKAVIAAALPHDPDVLVFDEPLSGLDATAAHTVKDLLRGLAARGKTVLYCSHLLDVVERLCDRVVILDGGRIVAAGTTAELLAASARPTLEGVFRILTSPREPHEPADTFLDTMAPQATDGQEPV